MDSDKIKRIKYLLKSEELYVLNNYFLYKSDIHLFRKVAAYFDILQQIAELLNQLRIATMLEISEGILRGYQFSTLGNRFF
jgi:hypothetical protein